MKKVFTLLMICTLSIGLNAQQFLKKVEVQGSTTTIFGQEVPLNSSQNLLFTVPQEDGSMLLVNSYENLDNGHQNSLFLQLLSPEKEVQWSKAYPDLFLLTHEPRADVAIRPTSDGGLIGIFGGDDFFVSYHLVRFDAEGSILWTKTIERNQIGSSTAYNVPYGIAELTNGDIFFLSGLGYDAFFLSARLDGATGELLSSKRIATSISAQISDVKATSDGGVLMVGAVETGGHERRDILLLKLDANEELEWARRIDEIEDIFGVAAYEQEENFVVFGFVNGAITAVSINKEDASVNWANAFFLDIGVNQHEPVLPINRDGDLVVFSGNGFDDINQSLVAVLFQFNLKTGDIDWAMQDDISQGYFATSERYARLQDGELLTIRGQNAVFIQQYTMENDRATGCSDNTLEPLSFEKIEGEAQVPFWLTTIQDANWALLSNYGVEHESFTATVDILCEQEEVVEEEEEEIDLSPLELAKDIIIAPNPTPDGVRIALHAYQDTVITLTLFDAAGRFIREQTRMVDGILDYDLSSLPAGTYFLQFRTETDVFAKRIVKIGT